MTKKELVALIKRTAADLKSNPANADRVQEIDQYVADLLANPKQLQLVHQLVETAEQGAVRYALSVKRSPEPETMPSEPEPTAKETVREKDIFGGF